jgi:hypothetical protein
LLARSGNRNPCHLPAQRRRSRLFCGSNEGSAADLRTAREHLVRRIGPLRIGVERDRYRSAARSLVSSSSAQRRIRVIADALLRCGSLDAEQIYELVAVG